MLTLHVKAPFGAFRHFATGSYRQSAPFVTPTAAYGLFLNLAGIESRRIDEKCIATDTQRRLPSCIIAIGIAGTPPRVARILHQLHNYPVGSTGKENAARAKGAKYNIQPITRETLCGIDAVLCLDHNATLEDNVREGLAAGVSSTLENGSPRYGIPFFGDNSYMIDSIDELTVGGLPDDAINWICRAEAFDDENEVADRFRMPLWIDRNDMTRTKTALFSTLAATQPPPAAWVAVSPPE
jgi:CRISPR-associated protein Cas5t